MKRRNILILFITAALFFVNAKSIYSASEANDSTEVIIVSALHQIHEEVEYFSFAELQRIIEALQPTILVLELTPTDLEAKKKQTVKMEYQEAIFPLIEKHGYPAVAMEPDEPLFSELVNKHRASIREAMDEDSLKVSAFSDYASKLIETLKYTWDSAAAVNSAYTDKLFDAKHLLQNKVFGLKGEEVWNQWNMHFLETIKETAGEQQGGRVVVIVGAEHSYWLRQKLKADKSIKLLDTEKLLGF